MIDAVDRRAARSRAQEEPRLYNLLENLCISRGITMPKLHIADDDALNAFATGLNEKQYSITVTRGLIDALNDAGDRSRARPRAHPHPQRRRAHAGDRGGDRRRDLVLRRDDVPACSSRAFCGGGAARSEQRRQARAAPVIAIVIALVLIAVAWLLSIVIRFALSRQREYLADAGSVELTKNPDAMISALRKIEGRGELARRQFGGDGNVHRQSARGLCRYFRHPSVGRQARRGAGEIRRRPRSRAAGAGGSRPSGRHRSTAGQAALGQSADAGPWRRRAGNPCRKRAPGRTRSPAPPTGPWGPKQN